MIDFVGQMTMETVDAAIEFGQQLAKNWDGKSYASLRKSVFPELCMAVGLRVDELPVENDGSR